MTNTRKKWGVLGDLLLNYA